VQADNLLSVYRQAQQSDPQLRAAIAAHQSTLEVIPQSRAALLPNIGLSGDVSRDRYEQRKDSDVNNPLLGGSGKETSYATNKTYGVDLRQPLFRRDRFIQLEQAGDRVTQADAELAATEQELILRASTRYFLVLGALDNLDFVKADKEVIGRTLEQATQRFEVGLTAITDVHEAQARYDIAVSEEINAEKELEDAREALRELTSEMPGTIEVLQPEIPLVAPNPADQDQWVTTALDQNPLLLAAQAAVNAARNEIRVQRAGHYPSVDLTANYSYRDNDFGGTGLPIERNDSAVGVELNLPLYQGGVVRSRTRQSKHQLTQSQEEQMKRQREIERQVRNNYRGVITGISRVKALRQAIVSNETALEAAETGMEVGTRTIVDVLDAQRELLRARRDHARARYDYLLDTLRLKQAAGILGEPDLEAINALLQ
jgi:outer membrane protein